MKVYQLLDVDEPWGLLKVEVPLNGSYEERKKLIDGMDVAVQAVAQNEYQKDDLVGADEMINDIAQKLGELGYEAERFYLDEINMK